MSTITEQEIRAFVGPNADYYLAHRRKTGFNWAAGLLAGFWSPYRKMYRISAVYWGILLLAVILEGMGLGTGILSNLVKFGLMIIWGLNGTRWYWHHTGNEIAQIQSQRLQDEEHIQLLTQQGGTNILSAIVFLISFILISRVILYSFSPSIQ